MIYKKLKNEDVLNMRLVSAHVKKEIDEHVDFHVILDQSYRRFRQLCSYRIRSLKVNHLARKMSKDGLNFSYPERIQEIIFDGVISQPNLSKMLTTCKNLQHLVFTHETLGQSNLFKSESLIKSLQQLRFIKSLNLQLLRYPASDPFVDEVNVSAFLNLTLPHLTTFKLFYSVRGNWKKLLIFLQRHAETLKCLELQAGDQADSMHTQIYLNAYPSKDIQNELDLNQLFKMRLTEFRFRDDVLFLNPPVKNIIFDLIARQSSLEVFHFHSPGDFTLKQLKELIQANAETVVDVTINNLKAYRRSYLHRQADLALHPSRRADMESFGRCRNLKFLTLSCSPAPSVNPNQEEGIPLNLTNLHCLPASLETLHLRGFTFRIEDIKAVTKQLINLKEFILVDGGRIQYSVLINSFLRNCQSLEFLNVRPVIARGSSDSSWWKEIKALNLVFSHFLNVPFDIDDLDGLEARIRPEDRDWIRDNIHEDTPTTY